ncbi:MAG TPA: EamA family transporter [Streptosporangiaceae bacterium]
MSPAAIALILTAAIAHASWNLLSKQASALAATSFIWLVAVAGSIGYAPVAAVALAAGHPRLTAASWTFLAGTGLLQCGYFLFLQRGYQAGDLSLVYPLGRGTGALLAALAGLALFGERPGPAGLAGIALIIGGVLVISIPAGRGRPAAAAGPGPAVAVTFAAVTGMFIASYTLWDKYAVSDLRTPALLQGYAAFPFMALAFAPLALRARPLTARVWRQYRPQVLGAAALAPLAYILVLIALSFSAVSAVAPAREVSVLFGVLLGGRLLGEGSLARRLAGAAAIVAGIVAVAIG